MVSLLAPANIVRPHGCRSFLKNLDGDGSEGGEGMKGLSYVESLLAYYDYAKTGWSAETLLSAC